MTGICCCSLFTSRMMVYNYNIKVSAGNKGACVKLGITLLVIGILLLLLFIPYSILNIVTGLVQLSQNIISGGLPAYYGLIGVVLGFVLTTIGIVRVFGTPR